MVTAFQQVVQGTTDYWGRSPWSDASLGKAPDPFYQVNGLVAAQKQNMVQLEQELTKRANYAKTVVAITPAGELYAFVDAAADNNPLAAALAGGGLVLTVAGTAYKITKSHNVGSTAFYKLDEVPNTGLSGGAARLADEDAFTSARLYELNPKHGTQPRIVRATFIGKRPTNPQAVLDNSVRIGPNTQRRIGYDPQAHEISIFDRDRDWWDVWDEDGQFQRCGIYHGHVRDWNQLDSQMKRALIDAGMFNRRGTYLGQ